jgi:hypothetical protein
MSWRLTSLKNVEFWPSISRPKIVTVSVGKSTKKFLDFNKINEEVTALPSRDADTRRLRVEKSLSDEDDPGIDFIEEQLDCTETLNLADGDVEKNYAARKVFLDAEFEKREEHLMKMAGPKRCQRKDEPSFGTFRRWITRAARSSK